MADAILKTEDLKQLTGYARDADVRRCLEQQGIVVFDGKEGIWTTLELINVAGRMKLGLERPEDRGEYL